MLTLFFKLQENGFMSFRKKIARVTFLLAVISLAWLILGILELAPLCFSNCFILALCFMGFLERKIVKIFK